MITEAYTKAYIDFIKAIQNLTIQAGLEPILPGKICAFSGESFDDPLAFTIGGGIDPDADGLVIFLGKTSKMHLGVNFTGEAGVIPVSELESRIQGFVDLYQSAALGIAAKDNVTKIVLEVPDIVADEIKLPRGVYGYLLEQLPGKQYRQHGIVVGGFIGDEFLRNATADFDAMLSVIKTRAAGMTTSSYMFTGEHIERLARRNSPQ